MSERAADWYVPVVSERESVSVTPRNCSVCGSPIPLERLEALPHALTCVNHSQEPRLIGFEVYSGKHAPVFCTVDPRNKEALRRAQRANRRAR